MLPHRISIMGCSEHGDHKYHLTSPVMLACSAIALLRSTVSLRTEISHQSSASVLPGNFVVFIEASLFPSFDGRPSSMNQLTRRRTEAPVNESGTSLCWSGCAYTVPIEDAISHRITGLSQQDSTVFLKMCGLYKADAHAGAKKLASTLHHIQFGISTNTTHVMSIVLYFFCFFPARLRVGLRLAPAARCG